METSQLIVLIYSGVGLALMAMLGFAIRYLSVKAKDSRTFAVLTWAAELVRAAVQHVEAGLKPRLIEASKDGKLTAEERRQLANEALKLVLAWGGARFEAELKRHVSGDVFAFLSGLIEQAVRLVPSKAPAPVVILDTKPGAAPSFR